MRCDKFRPRMAAVGHFRQIDPLPTLSACPLRSDRVRTFAPQRIDAVCQLLTRAVQQNAPLLPYSETAGGSQCQLLGIGSSP